MMTVKNLILNTPIDLFTIKSLENEASLENAELAPILLLTFNVIAILRRNR